MLTETLVCINEKYENIEKKFVDPKTIACQSVTVPARPRNIADTSHRL